MIEDVRSGGGRLDDVAFAAAGDPGFGDYRCAECSYGVSVRAALPRCPMCGGEVWEPTGEPVETPTARTAARPAATR